jgi:hypothetical protein
LCEDDARNPYDTRAPLLARRPPMNQIEVGRVKMIRARNGGVGVGVRTEDGHLGYRPYRVKWGRHYLWAEWD